MCAHSWNSKHCTPFFIARWFGRFQININELMKTINSSLENKFYCIFIFKLQMKWKLIHLPRSSHWLTQSWTKELKIGEYKSEINCQPACYICHNRRWSPQKKRLSLPWPLKWSLAPSMFCPSFPPPSPSNKCIKRKSSKSKTKVSRSDFFNKERALEESKCGLIS